MSADWAVVVVLTVSLGGPGPARVRLGGAWQAVSAPTERAWLLGPPGSAAAPLGALSTAPTMRAQPAHPPLQPGGRK